MSNKCVNCSDLKEKRSRNMIVFYKAVCIYLLGGLVGTLWETILNFITGKGFVYCNGSIFTPFNFVYGFGALFIILCLHRQTDVLKVFLIGAVGGGFVEYLLSFLEEKLLGTRSWNYEGQFLNLNGRTTVPYMVVWGLLCTAVVFLVYKPLDTRLDALPQNFMFKFSKIAFVVLVIDLMITVFAIFRYSARNSGHEAILGITKMVDKIFNDEFMARRFPQMKFKN